jgi:hypothetical protein
MNEVPLVVGVKQRAGDLKLFAIHAGVHARRVVAAAAANDIISRNDAGSFARAAGQKRCKDWACWVALAGRR